MLRPFVMSNDTERPWSTILLLSDCVRGEAAPVPLIRTAASRCWVCCVVATSRVSPVHRSSARSMQRPPACFQAGSMRRWRLPTFLFTPPNLKEDGKSPQSGPSDLQENPCYCNNPPPLTSSSTPVSKPQPLFRRPPPTSVATYLSLVAAGTRRCPHPLPCYHAHTVIGRDFARAGC